MSKQCLNILWFVLFRACYSLFSRSNGQWKKVVRDFNWSKTAKEDRRQTIVCARLEDPAISLQTARYMLTFTRTLVQAYNLSRIFERIKVFCEESFDRVSSSTKEKQKFAVVRLNLHAFCWEEILMFCRLERLCRCWLTHHEVRATVAVTSLTRRSYILVFKKTLDVVITILFVLRNFHQATNANCG